MRICDYTSCSIFGWMIKDYGLTGISLIIYAILFSESQGFSSYIDWDFIMLCTGLKPKEAEPIVLSFKERGMIEYDGMTYRIIKRDECK